MSDQMTTAHRNWCRLHAENAPTRWYGRFCEPDGELLHYVEAGAGEPLVLIHGFLEWSYTWRANLGPLAAGARVLAPDLRGHGLTGRNPRAGHGLSDQVEVLRAFLDDRGVDRAALCGHSMGGEVAFQFALKYPERVTGLVLVATAGCVRFRPQPPGHLLLGLPGLGQTLLRAAMTPRFAAFALRGAYYDPSLVTPEQVAAYVLPTRAPGAVGALQALLRDLEFGTCADRWAEVTQPTLLIWGDSDRVVPPAQGRQLATAIPNARLVLFERCGHLPHEEYPDRFSQTVAEFLRSL